MDYCLFCDRENKEKHKILSESEYFYIRFDNFAVSKGHVEIVPKRHLESFFDLNNEEILDMHDILKKAKSEIDKKFEPDGYNIGVNEGVVAGRSIHHLHIHLIPRYKGDVENPRGGVRHIIPGKGNY